MYNIHPNFLKELGELLEEIEKLVGFTDETNRTIKDWGISHTSMHTTRANL